MAGDYIQWAKGLANKREVVMVGAILKKDPRLVAACLMGFWEWCDDNVPEELIDRSGEVPSFDAVLELSPTPEDNRRFIDRKIGLRGAAAALEQAGWLELSGSKIRMPGFGRNNGSTAKTRGRNTKNKRNSRRKQNGHVPNTSPVKGDTTGTKTVTVRSREQRTENRDRDRDREQRVETELQVSEVVSGSLEGGVGGNQDSDGWELQFACLARVTTKDLGIDSILCGVHREANAEWPSVIRGDVEGLTRVFAAAEHAKRHGDRNPSGLFAYLLSNPGKARIDADAFASAKSRIRLHREKVKARLANGEELPSGVIPLCDEVAQ